jgi:cytochrome P450
VLDRVPGSRFDAVTHLTTAVPIRVQCTILGIPPADKALMIDLGDRLISGTDPDLGDPGTGSDAYRLLPFRSPAALRMHAYSQRFRARPGAGPGVLSLLASAQVEGQPFSQRDYDAMCLLLVVAGNETTRAALSLWASRPWPRSRTSGRC